MSGLRIRQPLSRRRTAARAHRRAWRRTYRVINHADDTTRISIPPIRESHAALQARIAGQQKADEVAAKARKTGGSLSARVLRNIREYWTSVAAAARIKRCGFQHTRQVLTKGGVTTYKAAPCGGRLKRTAAMEMTCQACGRASFDKAA